MKYAQVLRFVTVDIPERDSDDREAPRPDLGGQHLVLVVVRPCKLIAKNRFGQPLYSSLEPPKVIDAADIIDVIGRVPDNPADGPKLWAIVQRPGTIIHHELPNLVHAGS